VPVHLQAMLTESNDTSVYAQLALPFHAVASQAPATVCDVAGSDSEPRACDRRIRGRINHGPGFVDIKAAVLWLSEQ
jgi:hypothetical protein